MNKVLLLGLDGASFDLLMPWINEGHLPVLRKLIGEGVHGTVKSTIPCVTCPALPAIYTGMNPGNLGVFSFQNPDGSIVSSSRIQYKSIWNYMSENGKKAFISNLRTTFPPEKICGTMICGLHSLAEKSGLHSWEKADSAWAYPEALQAELDGWAIDFDNFLENIRTKLLSNDIEGYQNVKNLEQFRTSKFKELLLRDEYDFAFHWIEHTDTMNHLCWGRKDLILRYYREVVEPFLSDCLDTFKDWNIMIISDHGTAEQQSHNCHINTFLLEKGHLKTKWFYMPKIVTVMLPLLRRLRGLFPKEEGNQNNNQSAEISASDIIVLPDKRSEIRGVDWNNTVAYSDIGWGIRINRDIVGIDYDEVREKIISELKSFRDTNGQVVIQDAWKKEEIYCGKFIEQIPDIIILPSNKFKTKRSISSNVITPAKKNKIGSHNFARNGIFIAYGSEIAEGKKINSLNLYDIMPTILFMYDMAIPRGVDGNVLREIFSDESELARKEIRYTDNTPDRKHKIRGLRESEEKEMKKMLKSLGYF